MTTENLLPLFHEDPSQLLPGMSSNENDDVLAELLGGSGDDLLASLLEPTSYQFNQLSLPSLPSPPTTSYNTLLPGDTPSPTHDSCISNSPYSYISSGNSPESTNDVMVTSSNILPNDELDALLGSLTNPTPKQNSTEIKINVDDELEDREDEAEEDGVSTTSSSNKAATLVLTKEEKQLLIADGIDLPTDMPLTKIEQRHLKRVRRKIKNKLSAQESRKRKKEYVEGLEERVQHCTETNKKLKTKVDSLEAENKSLIQQLTKLHSIVAQIYPSKIQAGTLIMVLSLSFWFVWPHSPPLPHSQYTTVTIHSRTLLFTETDEFGNIIDPETGIIVSEYGGNTPTPLYPWSLQSPAFFNTITKSLTLTARADL